MAGGDFNFGALIVPVATKLWGNPKPGATKTEMRFGEQRTINPQKGSWFDFGEEKGGGVLDLVEREKGIKGRDAIEWLRREFGVDIPDASPSRSGGPGQARSSSPASDPPKASAPVQEARKPDPEIDLSRPSKVYDYRDADGDLVMQVCRYDFEANGRADKTFRQRRPDPSARGGWSWKMDGVRFVPYRLAELREAIAEGSTVFFVEGEKAADALVSIGVAATTNPMGAGKWFDDLVEHFTGADVVVIPDRDRQARKRDGSLRFHPDGRPVFVGQDHAIAVARAIAPVAKRVRVLELPGLPDKGDAFDWVAMGGDADALFDLVEEAIPAADYTPPDAEGPNPDLPPDHIEYAEPAQERGPFVSKFGAVVWRDLDATGPQHEWLIKGLVTRGELSMLAGPSQSGKSFVAIDIAMAVARGVEWMGLKVRRGGVVYQAGESAKGVRRKRLPAYRLHNGVRLEDEVPFVLLTRPVDLYASDDHTNTMIEEIRHWASTFPVPLELVVIDTWSAATPGANENASEDVSRVLARCQRICEATNAAVMIVHHMNAAGEKPRGHTSILANLDSVLLCKKVETAHDVDRRVIRELKIAKAKDGDDGRTWRFVLPAVEIGRDEDGDPITSCVVALPNNGDTDGEAERGGDDALKLSTQAEIFLRAVYRALDKAGQPAPPSLRIPAGFEVVDYKSVREEFAKMAFEDGEGDDEKRSAAIRQAVKRHGEALLSKRVIDREDRFIWLTGRKVRGFAVRGGARPVTPPAIPDDQSVDELI